MSRANPVQGRDYHCGQCVGRLVVACDQCVVGCPECGDTGEMKCPNCRGGELPVQAPVGVWAMRGTGGDSAGQG